MEYKYKPYILLFPAVIVLLGIFLLALVVVLIQSIGYFPILGLNEITLKYYKEMITNVEFLTSLKFSLYIALTSSILATTIGILLAYSLFISSHFSRLVEVIYKLPVTVPHTVAALLMFNILSKSGIVSRVFYSLGVLSEINEFPTLIFHENGIGIILTYLWKGTPFIMMMVYIVFKNVDPKLIEVAFNLGANNRQVFLNVLLPLAAPSILSGFVILFAFSFGDFEVPYLLGPTQPRTLAVRAYVEYVHPDFANRPYSMAISMTLTCISFFLIAVYHKIMKSFYKYSR